MNIVPPPTQTSRYECVTILDTDQQVMFGGAVNTGVPFKGLASIKSIVDECMTMARNFERNTVEMVPSEHRFWGGLKRGDVKVTDKYPHHILIRVKDKDTAGDVADYINLWLVKNRSAFPRRAGWQAMRVVGGDAFDEHHPFMRYKEMGKLDSKCARIIVVVERAVEGMNNKYLMIEGVACTQHSVVRNIQCRGRLLRSAGAYVRGVLNVPPRDFDRFYVVSHASFVSPVTGMSNAKAIDDSLDFIMNMSSQMGSVLTLDQYIEADSNIITEDLDYAPTIDWIDQLRIARRIGEALHDGKRVDVRKLRDEFSKKGDPPMKREYIRAIIESGVSGRPIHYSVKRDGVIIRPGDADAPDTLLRRTITNRMRSSPPPPADIVSSESLIFSMMDLEKCREWMTVRGSTFHAMLTTFEVEGEQHVIDYVNAMERELDAVMRKEDIIVNETSAKRVRFIVKEITSRLDADDQFDDIEALVHLCIENHLSNTGMVDMDDLEEDGVLNVAGIVHVLREENLMTHIMGFVTQRLLDQGQLTTLQAVLAVR